MFRMIKKYSLQYQFNSAHYALLDSLVVGILRYISSLLDDPDFCNHNSSGNAQILKELCNNPSEVVRSEAKAIVYLYAQQGERELELRPLHYTFPITLYNLYQVLFIIFTHH